MSRRFEHSRHLLRMLMLYFAWIASFLIVRALLMPADFGKFGHYRPAAVDEIAARTPVFAGKAACLDCHGEIPQDPAATHHAGLSCETCHGPLPGHAADPAVMPAKLETTDSNLCLGCHLAGSAKPAWFKQITPADHFDAGACMDCHQPHAP